MRYTMDDIQGITPAIDPRRSERLFAIAGRNYILDALGPKSAFGNRWLSPYPIGRPEHAQGCRLPLKSGDRVFQFFGDCIVEWSEAVGGFKFIYVTGDTTIQPYAWTWGYLNGFMYFCHPAVGILVYDIATGICQPHVVAGIPSQPIAIIVTNGRLVVIDDLALTWSGPGDGFQFTPQLGGAGFQLIAAHASGLPIMVTAYAKGVLTWTSGGVMRSEFTGDAAVFRHRPLNTEFRPINSFCTIQMDDNNMVILDKRGLFKSNGDAPDALTPLFNEFLIDYLHRNDLELGQNVRLDWDNQQRRIYLSLSLSEYNPLYERCFVLYASIDKWGTFDEAHYGILPVLITGSTRQKSYFGFVDSDARLRYWDFIGSREIMHTNPRLDSVYPLEQKPAHRLAGEEAIVLGSSAVVNTVNDVEYTQGAGFYPPEGTTREPASVTGLDSVLQIGLIRAEGDVSHDQMMETVSCFVGSVVSGEQEQVSIDFNILPPGTTQDEFESAIGSENFAVEEVNYVNHSLRIIGTVDGRSVFTEAAGIMVEFSKAARQFAGSVTGIWHVLEFSATEVGEAYHIQSFELTAIDAGRYM